MKKLYAATRNAHEVHPSEGGPAFDLREVVTRGRHDQRAEPVAPEAARALGRVALVRKALGVVEADTEAPLVAPRVAPTGYVWAVRPVLAREVIDVLSTEGTRRR